MALGRSSLKQLHNLISLRSTSDCVKIINMGERGTNNTKCWKSRQLAYDISVNKNTATGQISSNF